MFFGHIDKFWKEHDRQIKKNACKNAYLGSFFIPEKYVIRVLFCESMDEPDTPSCHSSDPPGMTEVKTQFNTEIAKSTASQQLFIGKIIITS